VAEVSETEVAATPEPENTAPVGGEQPPVDTPPASTAPASDPAKDGETKKDEPAADAPVEYDFTPPEGVQFDEEVLGEFKALAQAENLKPEAAKAVADMGAKMLTKWQSAQVAALEKVQAEWVEAVAKDAEIGGDTQAEKLAVAAAGMKNLASEGLQKLLKDSGLQNHPEVIRMFYREGKRFMPDKTIPSAGRGAQKDAAKAFYPNSNHN
jgi:hypothetical protein